MLGPAHVYETQIRESHLDSFGHVNHAQYLVLFEEARWELITANGYGLDRVLELGRGPVIVEIRVSFRRELRLRERIRIETECKEYKKKIGRIHQVIRGPSGELMAEAEVVFGLFDLVARRLVSPTPEWLRAIGAAPAALVGITV